MTCLSCVTKVLSKPRDTFGWGLTLIAAVDNAKLPRASIDIRPKRKTPYMTCKTFSLTHWPHIISEIPLPAQVLCFLNIT